MFEFMGEHPIVTLLIVIVIGSTIVDVVRSLAGNFPKDE